MVALAVIGLVGWAVVQTDWGLAAEAVAAKVDDIATAIFTTYALPFEIIAMLLLVAIIGAIFLARRPEEDERANGPMAIEGYLLVSALLFGIGAFGFMARRNAILMLISIELMFNAVNLSLVAFNAFLPPGSNAGAVFALMIMAVAAAEVTVGLALVIAIIRTRQTPEVDEYSDLKE